MFNKAPSEQIAQHNDGLATLKAIVELVQNPQPLLDAHETARQQNVLTEQQQAKYDDAVVFIAEYDQMTEALKKREVDVEADEQTHAADVESFKTWREEETERLKNQKYEQDIVQRQQDARAKKLGTLWKEMQAEYSKLVSPLDDVKAQNDKDAEANEKEKQRLAKLASKLDKRDSKLKEAIDVKDDDEEQAA